MMKFPLPVAALAALSFLQANLQAADPTLTIYNQGFAAVRETTPLTLRAGVNDIRYSDMTSLLEPDSVILRDAAGKVTPRILEQSYRNDPVSQELLLSLFEGKTLSFLKKEDGKRDQVISGKVVRSGFKTPGVEPLIEVDGELRFGLPGQPVFPSLGDDSILNPTLTWKIESPRDVKMNAEIAYVTGGFSWQADYNIVVPATGDTMDLAGWVTVKNESGKTFESARLKLMAGNVNKVQPIQPKIMRAMAMEGDTMVAGAAAPQDVTEKTFNEFHLYTLSQPTTLRDRESKQVEFVRSTGAKCKTVYVYDALQSFWHPGMTTGGDPGYGLHSGKKVAVYREFVNDQASRLGIPLPKGKVRFYEADSDGKLEFVGENRIDHTPKDEVVRLYTGDSFDLVGERKRTDLQMNNAGRQATEKVEIRVANRKKVPVEIRVMEHLFRWSTWNITAKSQDFAKKDAQTVEFNVALQPGEERTVTYTVQYNW